jgi:hypothetical protein
MKKIDLGQTITILANLGVIAGIVFLAVEMQQNNVLLEAEARKSRTDIRRAAFSMQIENPELLRIANKSRAGEVLTDDELSMLRLFWDFLFSGWQQGYGDYQSGLMELAEMRNVAEGVPFERWSGMREYWFRTKTRYQPDFVEWLDEVIESEAPNP